ncbi:hypothetical protein K438DRAFT_1786924 [Mycena galopus ATCC 62051]|nr:hypothetical protein K438DRAFT_1786924 [Mycena galopus ATCC 62051]
MRQRYGRNGVLLYVGGLLWWGEAAAGESGRRAELLADWLLAVDDVCGVLDAALKTGRLLSGANAGGPPNDLERPAEGVGRGRKRKTAPATCSSQNKENVPSKSVFPN